MEAIRKQASKLREQVAKQQQAVLKQLGHFGNEAVMIDEDEVQCHNQLQNLYNSTRAAKHFQRSIVRGVEGFISASTKQMEIVRRLAEDCCKYGVENESSGFPLARAALGFGESHSSMEKERESLLRILGSQVCEPLRALIKGAPLEDARQLTHRYDQVRQEVDAQAADVLRRHTKSRHSDISVESYTRLQNAEARLTDLKSSMRALGKEATAAMLSVEDQQQQVTYQRLCKMVDAERSYHQSVLDILEKLHAEMVLEEQSNEHSLHSTMTMNRDVQNPPVNKNGSLNGTDVHGNMNQDSSHFIAKVIHPFDAQADGELNLSIDEYVVVRQVAANGWSEGECKGNAGWFPSAYVEKQEKAPAAKLMDGSSTP